MLPRLPLNSLPSCLSSRIAWITDVATTPQFPAYGIVSSNLCPETSLRIFFNKLMLKIQKFKRKRRSEVEQ